jgi:Protein of unknown function (DUF1501)
MRFRGGVCSPLEHQLGRRVFLGSAAGAVGGVAAGVAGLDFLASPALSTELHRGQKRVLMLFLSGGASQFETWDPKPGRPTGGPFQTIETSIPGYRMCELMPRMATRMHKTAVIRSFTSPNADHGGARVDAILSGDRQDVGPLRTPSIGCMLARELSRPGSKVPDHVGLYTTYVGFNNNVQVDFAAFLGAAHEPINILNKLAPDDLAPPTFLSDRDHRDRETLRESLAAGFYHGRGRDKTAASHRTAYQRVRNLMDSHHLFDISKEPSSLRERYGNSLFAQQAIVARRLIEAGVPFVRLNRGWWDSHGENFEIHASLVPDLDQVMSALLEDLEQRGLLQDTLVVTFAEMGRTPTINGMRGRDHWGKCWSVTLTGSGIRGGVVHGSTNVDGTDVATDPVTAAQFFATIFHAVGIDHQKEYIAPDGRPVLLTPYDTQPVAAVLA